MWLILDKQISITFFLQPLSGLFCLARKGLAIYVSVNWAVIDSSNGLAPVGRQAITWRDDALSSHELLETNSVKFGLQYKQFLPRKYNL